ncbi:Thymidine kinase 2, mitochondrial [Chionoecetes opilio]|uniref:Thymidine kinase 2, mitochondrial n=1 Tax=Chionoecetes opilio TaxID=41210 RepID=A0A8J4Y9Q9_CHIOP|nr:Thymidine kinase 2, mitochondrial [Chionoecetes opilio]
MGVCVQRLGVSAVKSGVRGLAGSGAGHAGSHRVATLTRLLEEAEVHRQLTRIELPRPDYTMLLNGSKARFTVCVEGNIGSGKSTLLNHFSKFSDVQTFQEPVQKWRDVKGNNLLALMYEDPKRWAHTFQAYVQMTMVEQHLQPCQAPVKLLERSLYSGRHCFVENLYKSGKMTNAEYTVYCEWFKVITQNLDVGVDLIVYLRTDPDLLHARIKQRARCEELTIPFHYLSDLHSLHEDWLMGTTGSLPAPVLVLDANDTLANMFKKFEEHTSEILCGKLTPREREQQGADTHRAAPPSPAKAIN